MSLTLFQAYGFTATDVSRLSARIYRDTALVEIDVEIDCVLKLLSQNAPCLRRVEYVPKI